MCNQYIEAHDYCARPDGHKGDCALASEVLAERLAFDREARIEGKVWTNGRPQWWAADDPQDPTSLRGPFPTVDDALDALWSARPTPGESHGELMIDNESARPAQRAQHPRRSPRRREDANG